MPPRFPARASDHQLEQAAEAYFEPFDLKTGGADGGLGVAVEMAAAGAPQPGGGEPVLRLGQPAVVAANVLDQVEAPAGPQDTARLGQRGGRLGNGAKHERAGNGVERAAVPAQVLGVSLGQVHG